MRFTIYAAVLFFGALLPCFLVLLGAGRADLQSTLALAAGASAFSLMAINLLLSTRPRGLEAMVGGLDQLYRLHKWTGIAILPLILFHAEVGMDLEGQIVAQGLAKTAAEIAELAYPPLLVLLLLSWIKRFPKLRRDLLPYHLWRWTHRLLGVVFLVLSLHQLFVKVPFNANANIALYLNAMVLLGLASFVYTQFLAPFRPRRYQVEAVEKHPAATIITARPKRGKGLRARPGAFAVISFGRKGLREPHPFTLSQIAEDGQLQFSIRGLGDYTRRLRNELSVGDSMTVEGPYGQFDYRRGPQQQVWLAGGIGITPFLAFADALAPEDTRRIAMVYCVNKREEAVGLDRLEAARDRCKGFQFDLHVSSEHGRLDSAKLEKTLPHDIAASGFWFCGPAPMRESILKGLKASGKKPKRVFFEEFEFR